MNPQSHHNNYNQFFLAIVLFVTFAVHLQLNNTLEDYKMSNNKSSELAILRKHKYSIAATEGLGMKWYKFNIFFRLFSSIVFLFFDIVSIPINYGMIWGTSLNIDIYLCFAIIFDLTLIVGAILTRHWLAHFNEKGVKCYFATQYFSQVVLYIVIFSLLGIDGNTLPQTIGRLIVYGISYALEYVYWKRRDHLFNSPASITHMHSDDNLLVNKSKILFCRKCGSKLPEDALFCQECGTKIIAKVEDTSNAL